MHGRERRRSVRKVEEERSAELREQSTPEGGTIPKAGGMAELARAGAGCLTAGRRKVRGKEEKWGERCEEEKLFVRCVGRCANVSK